MFCPPLSTPPTAARGDACSLMNAILIAVLAVRCDGGQRCKPRTRLLQLDALMVMFSEKIMSFHVVHGEGGAEAHAKRRARIIDTTSVTAYRALRIAQRSMLRGWASPRTNSPRTMCSSRPREPLLDGPGAPSARRGYH